MNFRPCIDIHNGKVKQIVGSTLDDSRKNASENFVSEHDAGYFASLYRNDGLTGGHIIMLNPAGTAEYRADMEQARTALGTYPGGMQIGGGITAESAPDFIEMGASHVIVTSYVFRNGAVDYERLQRLDEAVGPEHVVLDLSCRRRGNDYYIVTDRWQKFTDVKVNESALDSLSRWCDEFLVHAVDVEGKRTGIDETLASLLGSYKGRRITYAGGVKSLDDLRKIDEAGNSMLDVTIGSALDIFGGDLPYRDAVAYCRKSAAEK